MVHIAQKKSPL